MAPKGYIPDGASSCCFIAKFVTRCSKVITGNLRLIVGVASTRHETLFSNCPVGNLGSNLTFQAERIVLRNRTRFANHASQLEKVANSTGKICSCKIRDPSSRLDNFISHKLTESNGIKKFQKSERSNFRLTAPLASQKVRKESFENFLKFVSGKISFSKGKRHRDRFS